VTVACLRPLCRLAIAVLLAATCARGMTANLPSGRPEEVGFSPDRLHRINELIQRYIDSNQISGAVTMVSRKGRLAHAEVHGLMDVETQTPMRRDAIFRIASMSKPVTGVAILMLMEEGKLRLTDPVSQFIPEFRNLKVAMQKPLPAGASGQPPHEPEIYTVPAEREVTIRDLMTHTSGLESGGVGTREASRIAPRKMGDTLARYIPQLGSVPLDFQPGTQWRYSALAGIETLGRIVEVTSGQPFDRFLETRIFNPLGMRDTAFYPTDDRLARVVTLYERKENRLSPVDTPAWLATKTLFSGGGGLWSTAEDYMQFAQMLVNGGVLNGTRLLSPRTVDLMASNHVRDLYSGINQRLQGMGFGLTVEVVLDSVAAGRRQSNGSFGWDGAFGTHFWVDRKEQLVGLLMVQEPVPALTRDFENAVMQAIVE
jgi:CubicO group peptidase (beta-lactamase class C family)